MSSCLDRAKSLSPGLSGSDWYSYGPGAEATVALDSSFPLRPVSMGQEEHFLTTNVSFRNICAGYFSVLSVPSSASAMVVNVTTITDTNASYPITTSISSCDDSVVVANATTTSGLLVLNDTRAAVYVGRGEPAVQGQAACPGESFVVFESAPLEDFCKVDQTLAACGGKGLSTPSASSGSPASSVTTPSPTSSSVKRGLTLSVLMTAAAAVANLAAQCGF